MNQKKMLQEKADLIIKDKKNANLFVDIIGQLENENTKVVVSAINAVTKVCLHMLNSGEIVLGVKAKGNDTDANEKYASWLKERYRDVCTILCNTFFHEEPAVRELSMMSMMDFVKAEGKMNKNNVEQFPIQLIFQIVNSLISSEVAVGSDSLMMEFIEQYSEKYTSFDDVRFYTMKALHNVLSKIKTKPSSLSRIFHMMKNLNMPYSSDESLALKNFFIPSDKTETLKCSNMKEQKKLFSTMWLEFLSLQLSQSLYENVLDVLHERVMPFMSNPLALSDFLILSYGISGSTGLLALNGLFILMTIYNLDYPDFYKKLYLLLEPSIFQVPYTSRFLKLLDTFLASTHLPSALAAAFIKKLSRLSLKLSTATLYPVIALINNLFVRHPNCLILVHNSSASGGILEDPFMDDEKDPMSCKALESSLWEIKTLQKHGHYAISDLCRKFEGHLAKLELPFDKYVSLNYTKLIEKEKKKRFKAAPENYFDKTPTLQSPFTELWTLSDS